MKENQREEENKSKKEREYIYFMKKENVRKIKMEKKV